ncbi:MAG: hypothetical protein AB8B65_05415 [Kordia sp.]|uniref:hypothetical protein n=1 Tax=Kordia sp. TaxID=1965332 RepID=UPI0038591178
MKFIRQIIVISIAIHLSYSCTQTKVDKDSALTAFVLKISDAYKSRDIEQLKTLYITESEFVEMFEYYGLDSDYGKSEYNQNVTIIDQDRFDRLGRDIIFGSENPIEIVKNKSPKMSKFSAILNPSFELDEGNEYYLMHGLFTIKSDYIDKYNNKLTETELRMNLGELIFIPYEGWRLCGVPR